MTDTRHAVEWAVDAFLSSDSDDPGELVDLIVLALALGGYR